ncbi:MAG: Non-heme chloroperoxidase [Hyphomicrobiaceae bacterium hypho_1]
MDYKTKSFNSDGVIIAYTDHGNGDPILLLHGFASNFVVNWIETKWISYLLGENRRVIAIDHRGHGCSQKLYDPDSYGAIVMAQDACRLLDHLQIDYADVMGYSMGARIAAFLTLANPTRIRSVIFGGLGYNMIRGMAGTSLIAQALETRSIDEVKDSTARTFRTFAEHTGSDLYALAACIRSSRDPVSRDDISRISCPVLVAVGTDDTVSGSASGLASLIPNAQSLEIRGRDHMKAVGDHLYKKGVSDFLAKRA